MLLTIVGFFLFLFVLSFMWMDNERETIARSNRSADERYEILRTKREQDEERLHSYGWIDQDKGIVRLPIDRAMELLLQETNQTQN